MARAVSRLERWVERAFALSGQIGSLKARDPLLLVLCVTVILTVIDRSRFRRSEVGAPGVAEPAFSDPQGEANVATAEVRIENSLVDGEARSGREIASEAADESAMMNDVIDHASATHQTAMEGLREMLEVQKVITRTSAETLHAAGSALGLSADEIDNALNDETNHAHSEKGQAFHNAMRDHRIQKRLHDALYLRILQEKVDEQMREGHGAASQ